MEKIINNNIEINKILDNNINQEKFLETNIGNTINTGIDIGLRTILPDYLEEYIIEIKNNFLNYGLKDGIKKSVDDAINYGKSTLGIITGKFENIEQVERAIKNGGIIDNISDLLDEVINKVKEKGLINENISISIKNGKNSILNNVEKNIEKNFRKQKDIFKEIEKSTNNWKNYYNIKDFNGMEKEYQKIEKIKNNLTPFEKIINDVKLIYNIHNLIKNNGNNFNLTEQELQLAEKLK